MQDPTTRGALDDARDEANMTSNAALFVVFNIAAGQAAGVAARAAIERACNAAARELHVLVVEDPQRTAELACEAVPRARQANGIVIAAGGDGTINAVAQATLGSGCAFGVLPQGTFNYFSRTHGIPLISTKRYR